MSSVVVPCSVPVPALSVTETSLLAPRPTDESLPKGSRLFSTGWVPKAEPAVAEPGWGVKTSRAGAGGGRVGEVGWALGWPGGVAGKAVPEAGGGDPEVGEV